MNDLTSRLIALAGAYFNVAVDGFDRDSDFFEVLGIDSLKALELLSEIEIEFDVEIPDYELQGVKTFGQLASKIAERT
jgi:acyl carrier protein